MHGGGHIGVGSNTGFPLLRNSGFPLLRNFSCLQGTLRGWRQASAGDAGPSCRATGAAGATVPGGGAALRCWG